MVTIHIANRQQGRPVFGLINVGPTALKNMDNMIDYYFRYCITNSEGTLMAL